MESWVAWACAPATHPALCVPVFALFVAICERYDFRGPSPTACSVARVGALWDRARVGLAGGRLRRPRRARPAPRALARAARRAGSNLGAAAGAAGADRPKS